MAIIDRGEILLDAEPLQAVEELKGRIWRRVIAKDALAHIERDYAVISTKLLAGRTVVRVHSAAAPGGGRWGVGRLRGGGGHERGSDRRRAAGPLLRATDRFLAYGKGALAMYALSEYVGEERVNEALGRLRAQHGPGTPSLATTLDLYRELQAVTPACAGSIPITC